MSTHRQSPNFQNHISFFTKEDSGDFPFFRWKKGYLFFTFIEVMIVLVIIAILALLALAALNSAKCEGYRTALTGAANNCRQVVSNGTPQSVEDCLSNALKELKKVKLDTTCFDRASRISLATKLKEVRDQAINRKESAETGDSAQWAKIIAKLDSIKIIGKLP